MIGRVAVFGDSYMYGSELPCSDPDMRPRVEALFHGIQRDHTGAIPEKLWKSRYFEDLHNLTEEFPDYRARCNDYCLGGYMARRLGVPHDNHARGGYSNDAIMAEIWSRRESLSGDTLVIVGLTYPDRTTRMDQLDRDNYITVFNNFSLVDRGRDHERFLELYMQYGDDTLTKVMRVATHIASIGRLLDGVPHVIIDPTNIYRQNHEIDGMLFTWPKTRLVERLIKSRGENIAMPGLVSSIQGFFDDAVMPYTLNHAMIDVADGDLPCREALGHPNRMVHEAYVDTYLYPYLEMKGILP